MSRPITNIIIITNNRLTYTIKSRSSDYIFDLDEVRRRVSFLVDLRMNTNNNYISSFRTYIHTYIHAARTECLQMFSKSLQSAMFLTFESRLFQIDAVLRHCLIGFDDSQL